MRRVLEFYESYKEVPGIDPEDFSVPVMKLRELAETYSPATYPYMDRSKES